MTVLRPPDQLGPQPSALARPTGRAMPVPTNVVKCDLCGRPEFTAGSARTGPAPEWALLDRRLTVGSWRSGAAIAALIAEDEKDLEELAVMAAKRQITRAEWMTARTIIEKRLEENRAKQIRQTGAPMLLGFVGSYEDMVRRWEKSLNDSQRRAIIAATVHKITVHPADPRKKWDPDRFEFDWVA